MNPAVPIHADLSCRKCGYNLRGLNPAGSCPECGQPIAESLERDWLHQASPDWVWKMSWGTHSLLFGAALITVAPFCFYGSHLLRLFASAAAGLLVTAGNYLLTARDPGRDRSQSSPKLRLAIRLLTILGAPAGIYAIYTLRSTFFAPWFVTTALAVGALLLAEYLLLSYLRQMVRRIPHPELERRSKLIQRFFVWVVGGVLLTLCFGLLSQAWSGAIRFFVVCFFWTLAVSAMGGVCLLMFWSLFYTQLGAVLGEVYNDQKKREFIAQSAANPPASSTRPVQARTESQ